MNIDLFEMGAIVCKRLCPDHVNGANCSKKGVDGTGKKGGIFTFLCISIIVSGLIIGSNLNSIANSIELMDTTYYGSSYKLVVQDGVIYM